jgi:hypothetical protein
LIQQLTDMERPQFRPQRVVVYIKDIEILTGKKPGAARILYYKILQAFEKKRGQYVTAEEFSIYTGICEETVFRTLNGK